MRRRRRQTLFIRSPHFCHDAAVAASIDNVFSDGVGDELATLVGSATSGYTATLTIAISI
jgi:hypothetical protein